MLRNISKRCMSNLSVIGAGSMGSGIAQVSAQSGMKVTLVDLDQKALDRAVGTIDKSLNRVVKKKFKGKEQEGNAFKDEIMNNITTSTDLEFGVSAADLVVEAIIENLAIKKEMFEKMDNAAKSDCIFASNTSSLGVREIADQVSETRKTQFGGLHFFNPVPMMKLLEVVQVDGMTSDETFKKLENYGKIIGKTTVKCKDTPGFILNRLLIAYNQESVRMYERGDASIVDIDTAIKLGCGYPMGPFELIDYTGLDIAVDVQAVMLKRTGNPVFAKNPIVNKLAAAGDLGIKSGRGFYNYVDGKRIPRDDL